MKDIEPEFDANGAVTGFVTNGLDFRTISEAGQSELTQIRGMFHKYSADLGSEVWKTTFNTGEWTGGRYQYSNLNSVAPKSLIYTECFGMTKVKDSAGNHVGYAASCGGGIEGCDIHNGSIGQQCSTDPRVNWRAITVRIDLQGNIVWYHQDNYKDAESASTLSSANEYIYMTSDGKFVGLTDETMGFGFVTYDCEAGVTCPGSVASTTTKPQTTQSTTQSSSSATTQSTTQSTTKTTQQSSTQTDGTTQSITQSTTKTAPANCPEMIWKGKQATRLMYRGKSQRNCGKKSYLLRQSIFNNSADHPDLRTGPYTGFIMFARKHCGLDFFNAMSTGELKIGVYDIEATYDVQYLATRVDGSKGSSITMQYKQNFVGQADYPWSKKFGNFVKKDQIFISLQNVPDSFDASMEEKCFNMINGVLPNNYDLNTDWSVCASTQRDAGW